MPAEVTKLTAQYMKIPLRIEVAPAGTTSHQVEQELFVVTKETKMQLLDKLLADTPGTVLVFSRTKHGAKKIAARIRDMGHSAIEIHSNRSLAQRKAALEGFKSGKYRIMVATDIAARGIDVKNISLVINYDLPDSSEDYVHRIGRTGRAGSFGKAVSFVAPEQRSEIKNIERLIKKALPIMALPPLPAPRTYITPVPFEHPGGGRGNNFRSRRSSGGQNRGTGRPRRRFNRS
jgi:ATP-dependent RNA helicase RhlE